MNSTASFLKVLSKRQHEVKKVDKGNALGQHAASFAFTPTRLAFDALANEAQFLRRAYTDFYDYMKTQICDPLNTFALQYAAQTKAHTKRYKDCVVTHYARLQTQHEKYNAANELFANRNHYARKAVKYAEDRERRSAAMESLVEMDTRLRAALDSYEDSLSASTDTNDEMRVVLESILQALETLELRRLRMIQSSFVKYLSASEELCHKLQESHHTSSLAIAHPSLEPRSTLESEYTSATPSIEGKALAICRMSSLDFFTTPRELREVVAEARGDRETLTTLRARGRQRDTAGLVEDEGSPESVIEVMSELDDLADIDTQGTRQKGKGGKGKGDDRIPDSELPPDAAGLGGM
ncbi:LOW QUALITY PROTEIN: hypothetical protein KIPB_000556 [Kipferlia bialata]|uniref:BAR domain-containing protein n=1 Tax=Kipferlia bialata TaxID=797122 RepID=A0A9K3CPE5_9EUKA|nr:LOW QUALITY PROTEIN: hypothetical protein KIPB_000556 [Kipferlia bialata]